MKRKRPTGRRASARGKTTASGRGKVLAFREVEPVYTMSAGAASTRIVGG